MYLYLVLTLASIQSQKAKFGLDVYRHKYEVDLYNENNYDKIGSLLSNINEANRLIFDVCETIEPESGLLMTNSKPSCEYNISYINDTEIILSGIRPILRNFLNLEKKRLCNEEKLECGELTIIVKLIDLINSVIVIALNNNNTIDLWKNLEIIDFKNLFSFYISSITNIEIITNITLSKQKANLILEQAKRKIQDELDENSFSFYSNMFSYFLGKPIKHSVIFIGNLVGSLFGEVVSSGYQQIDPSLSTETKLYLFGGIVSLVIIKIILGKII
jgi:hypothetical protein